MILTVDFMSRSYYEDIRKMPSVSEQEIQAMLREESQVGAFANGNTSATYVTICVLSLLLCYFLMHRLHLYNCQCVFYVAIIKILKQMNWHKTAESSRWSVLLLFVVSCCLDSQERVQSQCCTLRTLSLHCQVQEERTS